MRIRVPREGNLASWLRSPAVTARVGVWLGVCFAVAFLTGLVSHLAQSGPPAAAPWLALPTRPVRGYQVTQWLHVASGTAAVPLLLVKLWTVYPKLFAAVPTAGRALVAHGLERLSILVLVAASVFQVATGLANTSRWYPWDFSFRSTHYAVAWVAVGALVVHVAVKLPLIRAALSGDLDSPALDRPGTPEADPSALSRRALLRSTGLATGAAVVLSAASTVPLLSRVAALGVVSGEGPQGIPVNTTARKAEVLAAATDPAYRLVVRGARGEVLLTRADLLALPQTAAVLPIACVEGWSATGRWSGVRVRDLMALVGPASGDVVVSSLQEHGPFTTTLLPARFAEDPLTLLALRLDGEDLVPDHGYPARIIAPNRPGVLQTKWVGRLEAR